MTAHSKEHPVAFIGALGRIGHRIVPLIKDEFPLRLIDLREDTLEGLPVEAMDITDMDSLIQGLKGCSAVVNFAITNYNKTGEGTDEDVQADYRQRMLDTNIRGAYNVFEAARVLNIPKVVFISSMTVVLGDRAPNALYSPKGLLDPADFYACTKIFAEYTGKVYHRKYGIQVYCLRLGQPYPFGPPYSKRHEEAEKQMIRNPRSLRIMVTMADIARATAGALRATSPGFGSYNIVSKYPENPISVSDGLEIGFEPQDEIAKIAGV